MNNQVQLNILDSHTEYIIDLHSTVRNDRRL